jgi:hypothetical protein
MNGLQQLGDFSCHRDLDHPKKFNQPNEKLFGPRRAIVTVGSTEIFELPTLTFITLQKPD